MKKILMPALLWLAALPAAAAQGPCGDMALVPAGEFLMGSDRKDFANENPRHKVRLSAFCLDRYEVVSEDYAVFAKASGRPAPRQRGRQGEKYPALYTGWADAQAYCAAQGKTLPTEAQWEKAAGGGGDGVYGYGEDAKQLKDYAWFWSNSGQAVKPVGLKKPNGYGIYDMHGNAQEWVADWYSDTYYASSLAADPAGPEQGRQRVVKGGSSFVTADLCRSAVRLRSDPETRYSGRGFRCARPPGVK